MITGKRKHYSADFKAKVALDALRSEPTAAQLAAKHGVHHTMVSAWKRQAMDKAEVKEGIREGEVEKLDAKIGRLVVERDFLAKASGR